MKLTKNELRTIIKEELAYLTERKKTFKVKTSGPRMANKSSDDVVQLIAKKMGITRDTADGSNKFDQIEKQVKDQYDANKREINFKIQLEGINLTERKNASMELSQLITGLKIKDKALDQLIRRLVFNNTDAEVKRAMEKFMPALNLEQLNEEDYMGQSNDY